MVQWFQKRLHRPIWERPIGKKDSCLSNGFRNIWILKIELALSNNLLKKRPNGSYCFLLKIKNKQINENGNWVKDKVRHLKQKNLQVGQTQKFKKMSIVCHLWLMA